MMLWKQPLFAVCPSSLVCSTRKQAIRGWLSSVFVSALNWTNSLTGDAKWQQRRQTDKLSYSHFPWHRFSKTRSLRSPAGNQSVVYFGGEGSRLACFSCVLWRGFRFLCLACVFPYNIIFVSHACLVFIVHLKKAFTLDVDSIALGSSDKTKKVPQNQKFDFIIA